MSFVGITTLLLSLNLTELFLALKVTELEQLLDLITNFKMVNMVKLVYIIIFHLFIKELLEIDQVTT